MVGVDDEYGRGRIRRSSGSEVKSMKVGGLAEEVRSIEADEEPTFAL